MVLKKKKTEKKENKDLFLEYLQRFHKRKKVFIGDILEKYLELKWMEVRKW